MYPNIDECFMCTNNYNCTVVNDKIVTQVEYLLPEITITKLDIPLGICTICEKSLQSFSKFKQASLANSMRLEARIKDTQESTDNVADTEIDSTSETNPKNMEVILIKAEPCDDTTDEREFCVTEMQSTTKEDCERNEVNMEYNVVPGPSNRKDVTSQPNIEKFEEIYIKEEPTEENSADVTDNKSNNSNSNKNNPLPPNTGYRNTKRYPCEICNKYLRKQDFKVHMKRHSGIKDIQCPECNKLFTRNSDLNKHLKIHTGVKDFHCISCNKLFTQKGALLRHMKMHEGIKEFSCPICNKLFSQKGSMKAHVKTHSGTRDYQCSTCNKMFTQKTHLKTHLQVHKDVKEFQCNVCNRLFVYKNNMLHHMRKKHTAK